MLLSAITRTHHRLPRRLLLLGLLLAIACGVAARQGPAPAVAQAVTVTQSVRSEAIAIFIFDVDCDPGFVLLVEGEYHTLFHMTTTPHGRVHIRTQTNPSGLRGVGGTDVENLVVYRSTSVVRESTNFNGTLPSTFTASSDFHFIGQGAANDILVRITSHVTINANGTVTAAFDSLKVIHGCD